MLTRNYSKGFGFITVKPVLSEHSKIDKQTDLNDKW